MAKKLVTYFIICAFTISLVFILGCPNPDDDDEKPPAVSGLTISADTDGDGVILSWNEVSDVDGYDVITPDGDTILLDYDQLNYTDDAPATTGTYTVYSVDGDTRSDAKTISDAPTTDQSIILYMYDVQSTTHSAFGWNPTTGNGQTYAATSANSAVIDFYVDTDFTFTAPANGSGSYTGDKTTYILWVGSSDFNLAQLGPSGYANFEDIQVGYYAFMTEESHYAKVHVTAEDGQTVTFDYEFQTVTNLRLF